MYIAVALLSWWYGDGWQRLITLTKRRTKRVSDSFSVPSLLKTLFAPWRRIYTDKADNISEQLQAMGDNFVSRFVGFGVRFMVLLAAGTAVLVISFIGLLQIAFWPLVPPAVIVLLIMGFI